MMHLPVMHTPMQQLRRATEADIPFIIEVEHAPENREFIGWWTSGQHSEAMREADTCYLIALDQDGEPSGYAILRGITSEHRSMELRRIAMRAAGRGHGRQMLRLLLKMVFEEFQAHRLWLDVFEANTRAQHVYRSLGFQQDGIFREAVFRDGKYHSQLLMSILDREYFAARSEADL